MKSDRTGLRLIHLHVNLISSTAGRTEPDLAAALALLAQLQPAIEQGDRAGQVDVVARLVAMRAPMGEQWRQLSQLAVSLGEFALARAAIDLLAEAAGGSPAALYRKAGLLFELGAMAEANAVMRMVPDDVPDPIANAYSRGVMAVFLGQPDEARPLLERVLSARPQTGSAWLSLASMTDFASDPDLADRLIRAEPLMERAAASERGAFLYALGKVHADRGETSQAFDAYSRGAQQMKRVAAYNFDLDRRSASDAVRDYSAPRIGELAKRQTEPTGRTIFVTGPPRSGTTLVQQILTSHSAVADGGELSSLSILAREVGGASHDALLRYVETQGAASAARLWHRWLDERFATSGRIVDKSIDSSRFLGLVATLLPDAPLIWTTRDPLDRAWSCFRTNFSSGALPWSYELRDIATHFRLEERLLAQWQQLLGDRLLVVPYESLVAEPQIWIRRLLAHCGLSEEPQVFASHEQSRIVTTASVMQVRRPINRDGVGSSEPYRAYLEPFVRAYYD